MQDVHTKKTVKIHFVDFWTGHTPEASFITKILRSHYHVLFDAQQPDFLFYSCFGREHHAYTCVRICYLGENSTPDFNWCDYGIGFDDIHFGDRYFRQPLFRQWIKDQKVQGLTQHEAEAVFARSKFCNFLYSNIHAHPMRESIFDALCAYKPVDSGGKCRNTLGYCVKDGLAWQREYKFSITCENSTKPGYTTEKLLSALTAETIPIYWGNPDVAKDFNPARILQAQDFPSLDALVDAVRTLDNDEERFCAMLREPWFCEGQPSVTTIEDAAFWAFLEHIIEQGPEAARRIPQYGWAKNLLQDARAADKSLHNYERYTKIWRSIRRRLPF